MEVVNLFALEDVSQDLKDVGGMFKLLDWILRRVSWLMSDICHVMDILIKLSDKLSLGRGSGLRRGMKVISQT